MITNNQIKAAFDADKKTIAIGNGTPTRWELICYEEPCSVYWLAVKTKDLRMLHQFYDTLTLWNNKEIPYFTQNHDSSSKIEPSYESHIHAKYPKVRTTLMSFNSTVPVQHQLGIAIRLLDETLVQRILKTTTVNLNYIYGNTDQEYIEYQKVMDTYSCTLVKEGLEPSEIAKQKESLMKRNPLPFAKENFWEDMKTKVVNEFTNSAFQNIEKLLISYGMEPTSKLEQTKEITQEELTSVAGKYLSNEDNFLLPKANMPKIIENHGKTKQTPQKSQRNWMGKHF